jgi:sugar (pentulose or hexulose) kinase
MFPIDSTTNGFDQRRIDVFDSLLAEKGVQWRFRDVFPEVLVAGTSAGFMTAEGAALIDPSGQLKPGAPACPPEGDAGTGMVATNAVTPGTGNVSAGTSVFAMVVLPHELAAIHPELDMVTTPSGYPVAMVHSNNGTSEWDQWVGVFGEAIADAGFSIPKSRLYDLLYASALNGESNGGGILAYNFLSGEPIVGVEKGAPTIVRRPGHNLTLGNFMRAQLMTIFGALQTGIKILIEEEHVELEKFYAHGGLFKTPIVAQRMLAAALRTPVDVSVMAAEGGAWGIALLAMYEEERETDQSLEEFLKQRVFGSMESHEILPDAADIRGFEEFMKQYRNGLTIAKEVGRVFYQRAR